MIIKDDMIKNKKIVGKTDEGEPVVMIETNGGLFAFFAKTKDGIETLGMAPHKAIAAFFSEKKKDIKWEEGFLKSESETGEPLYKNQSDLFVRLRTALFSSVVQLEKSESLIKEQYGKEKENPVHGWISPEGKYQHLAADQSHLDNIDKQRGQGIEDVHQKGWISLAHAGDNNVGIHSDILNNPDHPATRALRRTIGQHWPFFTVLATDKKMRDSEHTNKYYSGKTFANTGLLQEIPQSIVQRYMVNKSEEYRDYYLIYDPNTLDIGIMHKSEIIEGLKAKEIPKNCFVRSVTLEEPVAIIAYHKDFVI